MANIDGVNPPVLNDTDYVDKIETSFNAIDTHDHSSTKGVPIASGGIAAGAVAESNLATVLANASKFLVRDASGVVVSNTKAVPAGVVVGDTDTQTLTNKTLTAPSMTSPSVTAGGVTIAEIATPSTPASGNGVIYFKSDGLLYQKDDAGTETLVGTTAAGLPDQSYELTNASLAGSVAASALTVALKTKAGSDPSGGSSVKIGFRNSTAATGTYNQRTVTGALSVVVPSGATLGHPSASAAYVYVYALDNAGTVELAVSSTLKDERELHTSVTIDTASDADSLYSTTGRTNVPIRLLGRLKSTQATAGAWVTAISETSPLSHNSFGVGAYKSSSGASVGVNTATYTTVASIELTPGDWQLDAVCEIAGGASITGGNFAIATATNSATGAVLGDTLVQSVASATVDGHGTLAGVRKVVTTTTTFYLTAKSVGASSSADGRISARQWG
jgi:hypothetical protein